MSSRTTQNVNSIVAAIISISVNLIALAVVVMCIYTFGIKAYQFGNAIFDVSAVDDIQNARAVVVTIPERASVMDIAELMKKAGLVQDKYVFAVQLLLSDHKDDIEAGTYTLSTGMLPDELVTAMIPVAEEEE